MTTEYNGWPNYATWLVKMWMDNDYGLESDYEDWVKAARRQALRQPYPIPLEGILADTIKAIIDQLQDESGVPSSGLFADLLNSALSEVRWAEIAENILADYPDEDDTDGETEEEEGR